MKCEVLIFTWFVEDVCLGSMLLFPYDSVNYGSAGFIPVKSNYVIITRFAYTLIRMFD